MRKLTLLIVVLSFLLPTAAALANDAPEDWQLNAFVVRIFRGEQLSLDHLYTPLSRADLRILRNAVYARHGRAFDSPDLRNYFTSLIIGEGEGEPYEVNPNYTDALLNQIDRNNLAAIQALEGAIPRHEPLDSLVDQVLLGQRLALDGKWDNQVSKDDLRILRNAIYARHGYHFSSPDLKAYFYEGIGTFSIKVLDDMILNETIGSEYGPPTFEALFDEADKANLALIQGLERR